jgi:hypothetical protein
MALAYRFDITDEGGINEYLGVNVTRMPDGTITTQSWGDFDAGAPSAG